LRIAFHVPRASHLKGGLSGDRVQVPALIAGLRERCHEVEIVSRVNVRNFWRGRIPVSRLVTEAISIRKEMKKFSPDAWLVYGPSPKNPDLFGWWQHPKRYVLWQTDPGGGKKSMPKWWRRFFKFVHEHSLARADQVAAYNPWSADGLRAVVAPERLHLFPPAIKIWDWIPSREESRQRLGLSQEAPVVLCVSRLTLDDHERQRPGKTEMVLDLMAALVSLPSDAVLVLVGDGPGRRRLEEAAAKHEPEGRVRLVGPVAHEDTKWYYAACDLFAYPYRLDQPFLAILEAQSCGRPVVTMGTRSAELTVDSGRTGLLAKDPEEFRGHLAALARDRVRCEAMGKAGPEYIAKFHSMETRLSQIEDLLGCS